MIFLRFFAFFSLVGSVALTIASPIVSNSNTTLQTRNNDGFRLVGYTWFDKAMVVYLGYDDGFKDAHQPPGKLRKAFWLVSRQPRMYERFKAQLGARETRECALRCPVSKPSTDDMIFLPSSLLTNGLQHIQTQKNVDEYIIKHKGLKGSQKVIEEQMQAMLTFFHFNGGDAVSVSDVAFEKNSIQMYCPENPNTLTEEAGWKEWVPGFQ